ncbi:Rrf2 family transcriptional regulator [Paenibacillus antri]|uniref:Rrf2 family transcriptional regulator n=1 Tax=Paenibacillus antri TaxID=2582848 RepID=A0A5R9G8V0_9BACL|nr:Rrf2 family transcriptional regulator [Paenibacillus antri]TLS52837.1 Rrf2 family transcriptional regulator [Paenibacillus antri]
MQFSKSTSYALHALVRLARSEPGVNVGIKELSASLGIPVSYLSKVMSKLRQDGLVRAVTGASGGYELARPPERISFLDVIQVIEGRQHLYECFHTDGLLPSNPQCLIHQVMDGAEERLLQYLREHTIQWVLDRRKEHEPTV